MRYAIVMERAGDNWSAYALDVPGCAATADTREEAERELREAIAIHLDGLREEGLPVPEASSHVCYVDIAA